MSMLDSKAPSKDGAFSYGGIFEKTFTNKHGYYTCNKRLRNAVGSEKSDVRIGHGVYLPSFL